MTLLEKFMKTLGYEKVAQVKPSTYPENAQINPNSADKTQVLDTNGQGLGAAPLNGAPEQLSGLKPSVELEGKDAKKPFANPEVKTPFSTDNLKHDVAPSNFGGPNERTIEPSAYMDVPEVEKLSPALAKRMSQAGILRVDRELFMKKYVSMVKEAASKRVALSDYLENGSER